MKSLFKKRIHPVIGYAFIFGAGIISLNQTMATLDRAVPEPVQAENAPLVAAPVSKPADLPTLKAAAEEFGAQLAIIKDQVRQLEEKGRMPPAELYDAIGEGEQMVGIIKQASSMDDLKNIDPSRQMNAIGRKISENARF
jgi:hypothetical protein